MSPQQRVLELSTRLADGDLSAAESEELGRLLAASPEAKRAHFEMLEVEAALRGMEGDGPAAAATAGATSAAPEATVTAVLGKIRGLEDGTVRGVLARIRTLPPPSRRTRPRLLWVGAGAAALAAAAALLLVMRRPPPHDDGRVATSRRAEPVRDRLPPPMLAPATAARKASRAPLAIAAGAVARRVALRGEGAIRRGDRSIAIADVTDLLPGDVVQVAHQGKATFAVSDSFTIDVQGVRQGPSDLRIEGKDRAGGGPRRVWLGNGIVRGVVAPGEARGVVFATPHAQAVVTGTEFVIKTYASMTGVEVRKGRVQVTRLADLRTTDVEEGHFLLVTAGEPMVTRPLPPEKPGAEIPLAPFPDETGTVVLRFDFEDGALPGQWVEGAIATDPVRPGGNHVLAGTLYPYLPSRNSVRLKATADSGVLLTYSPELVLRFGYFCGEDARDVGVYVKATGGEYNQAHVFRAIVRGRWATATLRLADLRPEAGGERPLVEGDGIAMVHIAGGRRGGAEFLVDDVEIVQYPLDRRPPTGAR